METVKRRYNVQRKVAVDHKIYISKAGELSPDGNYMYHPINVEVRFNSKSTLFKSRIETLLPLSVDYTPGDSLPGLLLNKSGKIDVSKIDKRLKAMMEIERLGIEHHLKSTDFENDDSYTPSMWLNEYTLFQNNNNSQLGYPILQVLANDLITHFTEKYGFTEAEALTFVPVNVYLIGNFVSCLRKIGIYDIKKSKLDKFNSTMLFINDIRGFKDMMLLKHSDYLSGGVELLVYKYSKNFFKKSPETYKEHYASFHLWNEALAANQ